MVTNIALLTGFFVLRANAADFARAAGKKEAEISKWMSGQHNFTIRTIAKIENVLGDKILHVKQFRSNTTNGSQHQMYRNSTSSFSASMLADEKKRGYKKH
ncbi:MAG: helix-turn-helix domain-containing protein [Bacteroidales bacterium]|nr:helix-turn-helix domain-containing protein [Bacteroidales bacterium]